MHWVDWREFDRRLGWFGVNLSDDLSGGRELATIVQFSAQRNHLFVKYVGYLQEIDGS
jgi:hypothetical protein